MYQLVFTYIIVKRNFNLTVNKRAVETSIRPHLQSYSDTYLDAVFGTCEKCVYYSFVCTSIIIIIIIIHCT